MPDPQQLSATSAVAQIAAGKLTAEKLAAACLERALARQPEVQAWAHLDRDQVLAAARAVDAGPWRGPLHGVPIGVKDVTDTYDMPTAYGSPIYKGYRPFVDAPPIALARKAGAVVMGKTVTTEFAHRFPGATRNPHNLKYSPGGSSSGSAAGVADFHMPLATGTQTGGSVIRPAAYCGVIGYKPSFGEIAVEGTKASAWSLDTIGLFARELEDVALFRAAMLGIPYAALDSALVPVPRIGLCRTPFWHNADGTTQALLEATAEHLAAAGAVIADVELPAPSRDILDAHRAVMMWEVGRTLADEAVRFRDGLSHIVVEKSLPDAEAVSFERYQAAQDTAAYCRRETDLLFEDVDLLLTPSTPGEPPEGITTTGKPYFNSLWTLLHLPCVTLPAGNGPNGLPLGIQLVGRIRRDWRLLNDADWVRKQLS